MEMKLPEGSHAHLQCVYLSDGALGGWCLMGLVALLLAALLSPPAAVSSSKSTATLFSWRFASLVCLETLKQRKRSEWVIKCINTGRHQHTHPLEYGRKMTENPTKGRGPESQ